jgi:hypothetical protein
MSTPAQQALSNFYMGVMFQDPLIAAIMSEDVIAVAINSMALDNDHGQIAADRLREKSRYLPGILCRELESALTGLGYS